MHTRTHSCAPRKTRERYLSQLAVQALGYPKTELLLEVHIETSRATHSTCQTLTNSSLHSEKHLHQVQLDPAAASVTSPALQARSQVSIAGSCSSTPRCAGWQVHEHPLLKSLPHPSSGDPLLRSISEMSHLLPLDSICLRRSPSQICSPQMTSVPFWAPDIPCSVFFLSQASWHECGCQSDGLQLGPGTSIALTSLCTEFQVLTGPPGVVKMES